MITGICHKYQKMSNCHLEISCDVNQIDYKPEIGWKVPTVSRLYKHIVK